MATNENFLSIKKSMEARLEMVIEYVEKAALTDEIGWTRKRRDQIGQTVDLRLFINPENVNNFGPLPQMTNDLKSEEERADQIPTISNQELFNTCFYSIRVLMCNWTKLPFNSFDKTRLKMADNTLKMLEKNLPEISSDDRLMLFVYNEFLLAVPPIFISLSAGTSQISLQWMDVVDEYFNFLEGLVKKG